LIPNKTLSPFWGSVCINIPIPDQFTVPHNTVALALAFFADDVVYIQRDGIDHDAIPICGYNAQTPA
jgi:hypothetical protein